MSLDRPAALRREHAEIVRFCRELGDDEWRAPSAAPGWRVQDVVAHLGGSAKAIFTPTSLKLLASNDIERTNDELVARRRDWAPARILAEFEQWGRRLATLAGALSRTPVAALPLPLGELGRFPAGMLLNSAFVFDQHTHLRYDIAPALGRPAPESDELRVAVVLEWMFAVLGNQLRTARPAWLDRPIAISLIRPGRRAVAGRRGRGHRRGPGRRRRHRGAHRRHGGGVPRLGHHAHLVAGARRPDRGRRRAGRCPAGPPERGLTGAGLRRGPLVNRPTPA